jgi:hypothetical protein
VAAGELSDARFQILWQQSLQANAFFQAYDAILHRQRKRARIKHQHEQRSGCEHVDKRVQREAGHFQRWMDQPKFKAITGIMK